MRKDKLLIIYRKILYHPFCLEEPFTSKILQKERVKPITKRIVIGITGASGAVYGIRCLELLKQQDIETHLIISEAGKKTIEIETGYKISEVEAMADKIYKDTDIGASIASGSFLTAGMIVIPCTIKTLSAIANSYTAGLLVRAADVTLKEKRKLVLVVRETPLHQGHLQMMLKLAVSGAYIFPPVPAFYHHPQTIDDIINHSIGKIFDYLGLPHRLFKRWGEPA